MNKELTPLEALERIKLILNNDNIFDNEMPEIDIIETALKEKETQDGILKTLKEIIKFSITLPYIEPNKDSGFDIMSAVGINIQRDIENRERKLLRKWVLETCFPKELKALEIIKEKGIILQFIKEAYTVEQYNAGVFGTLVKPLTQEEYDLLKEVLL